MENLIRVLIYQNNFVSFSPTSLKCHDFDGNLTFFDVFGNLCHSQSIVIKYYQFWKWTVETFSTTLNWAYWVKFAIDGQLITFR